MVVRLAFPASEIGNPLTKAPHRLPMVSMKGAAFALGGVGLILFLLGVFMAVTAHPPSTCKTQTCPSWDTSKLVTNILFLWIGGLVLEFAAVVFLFLHFRDLRRRPSRTAGASAAGADVMVTRQSPPRQY